MTYKTKHTKPKFYLCPIKREKAYMDSLTISREPWSTTTSGTYTTTINRLWDPPISFQEAPIEPPRLTEELVQNGVWVYGEGQFINDTTFEISPEEWAPGIWAGNSRATLEFVSRVTGVTFAPGISIASIDMERRQITMSEPVRAFFGDSGHHYFNVVVV